MKTKLILIFALISLNINFVSAHIHATKGVEGPTTSEMKFSVALFAPITPAEATFEDATYMNPVISSVSTLAPVTPKDATFEEISGAEKTVINLSTPVNQKVQTMKKGKTVHYEFPLPCDAKYGCSL